MIQSLHSHRFILSSMSDAFISMFSDNWHNGEPLKITSNTLNEFKTLLEFAYIGYDVLQDDNIFFLMDLAECYHILVLKDALRAYITCHISGANFYDYYKLSQLYHLLDVHREVMTEFSKNAKEWLERDQFIDSSKEFVLEIVKLEEFEANEEWLFQMVSLYSKEDDSFLLLSCRRRTFCGE